MFDFVTKSGRCAFLIVVIVSMVAGCGPAVFKIPAAKVAVDGSRVSADSAVRSASSPPDDSKSPTDADSRPARKVEVISPPVRSWDLPQRIDPSANLPATNSVTVAVEGMPTRNFLNYVFGELLKVNFIIVEGTPGLEELVSFNAPKPVSSRQLFRIVTELLATRRISVSEREGTFFIGPADAKTQQGLPIGYGRNVTDVPEAAGDIFQIVPMQYGLNFTITSTAARFTSLNIVPDPQWDAYFVTGPRSEILKFLDLVHLLDRQASKGSRIGLVTLTFIGAKEFVDQTTLLLANEGIVVGTSPVSLVPVDRIGAVVVFSSSEAMLERVEFWARQLDRPGEGPSQRYFVYQPRFARAADLGESISALVGGGITVRGNTSRDTRSAMGASPSPSGLTPETALRRDEPTSLSAAAGSGVFMASGDGVTLSVDDRSNSLIFYTTGPRYEGLLPMIRRLDVPPKQIVLEAMIAEVTLTGEFSNGVEFAFREGMLSGGTAGGIGLPSGGLALTYDANIADQIRLRLQASDARVNVLSSPILVVKDGVAASINVGNDVPTVGATASSPTQSDRLVTTVLYRKTGLNLSITPNINAEGSVLLSINQSTVSTVPGSSGVSGAPIFFQRSVTTEVVAGSGQTVFLAGLRSESDSTTSARVPVLGQVPLIGKLFSSDTRRREKTELVVLITPRILDGMSEWDEIMKNMANSMQLVKLPSTSQDEEGTR